MSDLLPAYAPAPPDGLAPEVLEALAELEAIRTRLLDASGVPRAPVGADGLPGNVAAGELVEAAWGNEVVASFQEIFKQAVAYAFASAGGSDWPFPTSWNSYVSTTVAVPAWCTAAVVVTTANLFDTVAANNGGRMYTKLGTVNGWEYEVNGQGIGSKFQATQIDVFNNPPTGTQPLSLYALHTFGTGKLSSSNSIARSFRFQCLFLGHQ